MMLDAMLGTPENLGYLESELLHYSASIAPMPRYKRSRASRRPIWPSGSPRRWPCGSRRGCGAASEG